ncbi:MAG: hypothetical protein HWE20_16800 [Gammaproteobacteria bacterium]|nr:hypothetical protein [Gammaproteobacteria bacterium]
MMKDIFVDQLMNVSVFQGVARMDFARIDSVDSEANQAKVSPSYRVCMSMAAFANLADQVANAKSEMQRQMSGPQANTSEDAAPETK